MRYTTKRNGKNVIPLLNAVCGIDMPYWRIDRADALHSYLSGDAADKLAAYEDTGLTPTQIKYILPRQSAEEAVERMIAERERYDEWFAWKQAEEDRRLVILPCKIGTECWRVNFDRRRHPIEPVRFDIPFYYSFGKTVFLTRAEAEAALKGEREDV